MGRMSNEAKEQEMGEVNQLSDIDLAALVSSKICHDAIGPMTAVGFGLDVLEEGDAEEEEFDGALEMIKKGVGAITAKVQFARLAFGAAGSAGLEIDLQEVRKVATAYVESEKKHEVEWTSNLASLPKNHVKLLLNLVAIAMSTVPRGGNIAITIDGDPQHPAINIRTSGAKARVPEGILELIAGTPQEDVDARSIQPYFTGRVARATSAELSIGMEGEDVVLSAHFS